MPSFNDLRDAVYRGTAAAKADGEALSLDTAIDLALDRCANTIGSEELEDAEAVAELAAYCEHMLTLAKEARCR